MAVVARFAREPWACGPLRRTVPARQRLRRAWAAGPAGRDGSPRRPRAGWAPAPRQCGTGIPARDLHWKSPRAGCPWHLALRAEQALPPNAGGLGSPRSQGKARSARPMRLPLFPLRSWGLGVRPYFPVSAPPSGKCVLGLAATPPSVVLGRSWGGAGAPCMIGSSAPLEGRCALSKHDYGRRTAAQRPDSGASRQTSS